MGTNLRRFTLTSMKSGGLWFFARPINPMGMAVTHRRHPLLVLALVIVLCRGPLQRARAQDDVIYRYENYQEDGGRIGVQTQSGQINATIEPWLSLKGQIVNDAVSGATPTGYPLSPEHLPANTSAAQNYDSSFGLAKMHDNRTGGFVEPTLDFGANHFSPQFAYSIESDYISKGAALNYVRDFNQKNTTLNVGWSHNFDTVEPGASPFLATDRRKDTDSIILGVTQLLGPKTVFTADVTFVYEQGLLADPYKGFLFYDQPYLVWENRPDHRSQEIVYAGITQFVTPLNGSAEASWRFYHDSFGVLANTVQLAWYQKLGQSLVVSPSFRYYVQSAADFYHLTLPGEYNPQNPASNPAPGTPTDYDGNPQPLTTPRYYSADYRLSEMETFTLGINVHFKVVEHIYLDASFERYIMRGLDGVTPQATYPSANVITVGAHVSF